MLDGIRIHDFRKNLRQMDTKQGKTHQIITDNRFSMINISWNLDRHT